MPGSSDRMVQRSSMKGLVSLSLIAVLAAGVAIADARAESLEEVLAKTYDGNPTLLAARAQLRATDELIAQAISGKRPTVAAAGELGLLWRESEIITRDRDPSYPASGDLQISQPIYRGGSIDASIRQADNLIRAQRAALDATEQSVLFDAVTAYMNVVRDEAVLQLTINNEQVLQRQLAATRDRFEVGEITRTDVAQAESRLSRATAERIGAEGNLTRSRAIYREIIGDEPVSPTRPPVPANLPGSEMETVAGSEANPAIISAQFSERAARDGTDVVFGELLPRVTLNGQVGAVDDFDFDNNGEFEATVTAQVVIPLYQAGSVDSRVREAKQRASQRRIEIESQRRNAVQTATSAWRALETARAQIVSFESEVRATQIALEGVQQEALVGARTVLDVLDAEQEYLNAQVSLVQAQRDEVVAAYAVLAAVGQLRAASLELEVTPYDDEEHYREVRAKWWGIDTRTD